LKARFIDVALMAMWRESDYRNKLYWLCNKADSPAVIEQVYSIMNGDNHKDMAIFYHGYPSRITRKNELWKTIKARRYPKY